MAIDVLGLLKQHPQEQHLANFATSWLLPTTLLGLLRILLSIYAFTSIAFSFKWFADHDVVFHLEDIDTPKITFLVGAEGIRQSFSYFTYITYWGLAFYFFFASLHSFSYARSTRHRTNSTNTTKPTFLLQRWPRSLQILHSIYYSTITCFPLLVTTVYWGSMWSRQWWTGDRFQQWSMLTMHGLNSVFALFEIIFADSQPLPLIHLPILLLLMSLYLPVAYITKATEGIYIYLWLDPNNGIAKLLLHILRRHLVAKYTSQRQSKSRSSAILTSWVVARQPEYWSFDRYEREKLREEEEKQAARMSVSSFVQIPDSAHLTPGGSREKSIRPVASFYSQATTAVGGPESPLLKDEKNYKARRSVEDFGWPLATTVVPYVPAQRSPLRETFQVEDV
ncbi:uncharacterized protein AB675_1567 [Cyphellophora attinorum]|uniref:Uncharacterized protein n=1 Tax=Cyphellophora attinorum TaxID=1664694 RepID=A0A0N0NJZ7_9EURO|nr:uncharacterized protein AB675_1567 [Phialophora attinorum]KPI37229.1 hypothetical protein AB675_1567 [Phialophora attinorum]